VFLDGNGNGSLNAGETSVVTNASGAYSFSGLITGSYSVCIVAPSGYVLNGAAPVTINSAGQVMTGVNLATSQIAYAGTGGSDTYLLRRNGTKLEILVSGVVISSVLAANVPALSFDLKGGDDTLTLDYVGGTPTPAGGISIDGGSNSGGEGGGDSVIVNASGGADTVAVTPSSITANAGTTSLSGVESLTLNTLGGDDTINVAGGPGAVNINAGDGNDAATVSAATTGLVFAGGLNPADHDTLNLNAGSYTYAADLAATTGHLAMTVGSGASATFSASQHLESLTLAGTASIAPGGDLTLITESLAITGVGRLDLADNGLVVDYDPLASTALGSWTGSAYSGVAGFLASAYASGAWTGGGIGSSAIVASPYTTSLAVDEAARVLNLTGDETGIWRGQTIDASAVIVKYTYAGDTNLDGKLNGDDYFAIDSHINLAASGWINGDFDYNGFLNGDDYFLIDSNYGSQGPLL